MQDYPQFLEGDIVTDVDTGRRGTVVTDHGNGIVRVLWEGEYRRPDRDRGERGHQPLVTDIGAVRLCA